MWGVQWSLMIWYMKGLLTPVVAILAVLIAYQQWKTNSQKVKLDLFEKRFRVFEAVKKLVSYVISEGDAPSGEVSDFRVGCAAVGFLFGEEVKGYIDEIYERASRLRPAVFHSGKVVDSGAERDEIVERMREQMNWFREQPEKLPRKFKRYLDLSRL